MAGEKSLGCQHEVNGERCGQRIDGQGARKYCSLCRDEAQDEAKRTSNKKSNDERRVTEGFHEDNRLARLLSYYKLTKPQLEPLFKNAETPPEEYTHKDDFAEDAAKKIEAIKELIIQPRTGLPAAAKDARKKLKNLLTSLEEREQNYGRDATITQLKLPAIELERDIGMWDSGKALTKISGKAKKVQKLMHQHRELYGFIHALLVRVEIFRVKYFSTHQMQFLVEALTWLNYAENVCDQALNRLTGERKQMALYLRLYMELIKVRLAFDSREEGQLEQAGKFLKEVYQRAAAVEDAYGGGQVVATASFVTSASHTEYDLRRGNIDLACHRLSETEGIFPMMHWHSIESQHRITFLKTALALENNDPESQGHLQNYMTIFGRYPSYEYLDDLRQLIRAYSNQLAYVNLSKDHPMFLDTTFTHILPHLRYV